MGLPREKRVYALGEALEIASSVSSPLELVERCDVFIARTAELAGLDIEDVRALEERGELEKYMSLKFYALSSTAIEATNQAIEEGGIAPEALPNIAINAAKVAHKLSGREVKKSLTLSADLWETMTSQALTGDRDEE